LGNLSWTQKLPHKIHTQKQKIADTSAFSTHNTAPHFTPTPCPELGDSPAKRQKSFYTFSVILSYI